MLTIETFSFVFVGKNLENQKRKDRRKVHLQRAAVVSAVVQSLRT